MDIYMPMSTTKRHNELITTLTNRVFKFIEQKEIYAWSEQCPLVYFGTKKSSECFELVDIKTIGSTKTFIEETIYELEYVQPDFMLFRKNPYLENKKRTRTAGQPDLVVEIWSENNRAADRKFLQTLYATSPATEHWYIDQDSNDVICYFGNDRLTDQSLTEPLKTRDGIEFDLRYLAI